MAKKGQISQTFAYVAGAVIAAIAIYYGVSSVIDTTEKGEEGSLLLLMDTIKADVERISALYGSNRTHTYVLGDFNQICFTDVRNNTEIANDPSAPAIIRDSAEDDVKNQNVFLLGEDIQAFYGGDIRFCKSSWKCFPAPQGRAEVTMYGGGGFAEFDPCEEEVLIGSRFPICGEMMPRYPAYNKTETNTITGDIKNIDLKINGTDPLKEAGSKLFFDWSTYYDGNLIDSVHHDKASNGEDTYSCNNCVDDYGVYVTYVVVTSEISGFQCSFRFERVIAEIGEKYPTARIIEPLDDVLQVGTTTFKGEANYEDSGALQYTWDWGDGTFESGATGGRGANEAVTVSEDNNYPLPGQYYTVKFTVEVDGNSATDARVYAIGSQPPWVVLDEPLRDAQLTTAGGADFMDVEFNFTPHNDIPAEQLNCQLLLDGRTYNVGAVNSGTKYSKLVEDVSLGEHLWAVSCSDGISTNTSETRRFRVSKIPNTPPTVTLNSPADENILAQPVTLSYSFSDPDSASLNCTVRLFDNSGSLVEEEEYENLPGSGTRLYPVTSPLITGDTYDWNVSCTDGIATANSNTWNFTIEELISSLVCTISSGACSADKTPMLAMSGLTNAHVDADMTSTPYGYRVCCNMTGGILVRDYPTCLSGGVPFLSVASPTNSHSAGPLYSLYTTKVCLRDTAGGSFTCAIKLTCETDETCLLSLSGIRPDYANSHVGDCAAYPQNKLCCKAS